MAIQALPESSRRLLSSSVNITSSCDVVKELLENALDAQATVVEITLSSNTVDRISVKDNGSGIDIDDFNALGRRAHTSKLRDYIEVTRLGGTTLGFRGEALASVNAMASMTITTKRPGDPIAWRVEVVPGTGGVKERRPVSSTVGTTVAVTKLFESLPARKQYALKQAKKCTSQIQQLLSGYVLARPSVRLTLKIIGNSKPVWAYSPKPSDQKRETILQMFGTNVWTNCMEISETINLEGTSKAQLKTKEPAQWEFSGYIPMRHGLLKEARARTTYLSIDNRPMSSGWKITKKIANVLKSHMSQAPTTDMGNRHSGIFFQLNINCPPSSYDPNITTRKDELLLFDEKRLLQALEVVCKRAYGKQSHSLTSKLPTTATGSHPQAALVNETPSSGDTHVNERVDMNTAASTTGQHDDKDNTPGPKDLPKAASRPKVKKMMRTTFEVNMGHRNGDGSDDEDDTAIEVEIPQLEPVREAHSKDKAQQPGRRDSIRYYFQSKPKADFHISCDNTATGEISTESAILHQLDSPSPCDRIPLQQLSDTVLNKMRDEEESSPEPQLSDSIVPRIVRSPVPMASMPLVQQIADATSHLATRPVGRIALNSHHVGRSNEETNDEQNRTASLTTSSLMLTPPPSDPRTRQSQLSPQIRPRPHLGSATLLRTNMAQQRQSTLRSYRGISLTSGSKQGTPSIVPYNVSTGRPANAAGRFNTNSSLRSQSPSRWLASPQCTAEGFSPIFTSHSMKGHDGMATDRNTSFSLPGASSSSARIQPHLVVSYPQLHLDATHQVWGELTPTPAAFQKIKGRDEYEDMRSSGKAFVDRQAGLGSNPFQPTEMLKGTKQDSRYYLTQRQRSRVCQGQVRRMSTKYLPFESIDTDRQTFSLSTVISLRSQKIQQGMNEYAALEPYITSGGLSLSLPFRNLSDTHIVQEELHRSVNSWMKNNDVLGHVEYGLQSGAKGKSRAD